MHIASLAGDVVVRAPAKVNLFLEVTGKRPDGYHDLGTLMLAVSLHDTLCFRPASQLTLTCDQPRLSTGPDNLIQRAGQLLADQTGCRQGATIRLTKRIPMQAGLGGGSSDAAATLVGLNHLWGLGLAENALADLGAKLGSDVPFFVRAKAAWCTGRGEIIEPMTVGRRLHLVLVCPDFGCPTAAVYQGLLLPAEPHRGEALRKAVRQGDIDAIGRGLHNRLGESAQRLAPRLTEYLDRLRRLGPVGVCMSGSGSSVFALCAGRQDAKRLARDYERAPVETKDKVFVVRSRASPLPS